MTRDNEETLTDQQLHSFVRSFVHGIYRDRTALDQAQALAFMQRSFIESSASRSVPGTWYL